MNNFELLHDNIKGKKLKIGKHEEIFNVIGNDKINNFFESYKEFDEFLIHKSNEILAYSGHVFLDAEVSGKLYSDFFEAFEQSIKGIIGEELFERLGTYLENKEYILSNHMKMFDSDPFLDDELQTILLGDNTVAQLSHRRNSFNNIEFNYIIYPNRIFSFIDNLLKKK